MHPAELVLQLQRVNLHAIILFRFLALIFRVKEVVELWLLLLLLVLL